MKNANRFSVSGFQFIATQSLMLPDGLKQSFVRKIFIAQSACARPT
jgi:hypothetical protein